MANATIAVEAIVLRIHVVRGIRVLFDSDLAALSIRCAHPTIQRSG